MHNKITSIELIITDDCNLRCSYCYQRNNKTIDTSKKPNFISKLIIRDFIDLHFKKNLSKFDNELFISFWGGEPLLYFSAIKYAVLLFNNIKNIKKKFAIITNGTLVNKDIAIFCNKYNIEIQITIDGDKNNHNLLRRHKNGINAFDTIIKNPAASSGVFKISPC